MKISTIAGTRPEIVKLSQLIPLLDGICNHHFLYTDQHYSQNMKEIFFQELLIREPDCSLSADSSDYDKLNELIYSQLEKIKPDYVIVYGDTNSTVAGAKAGKAIGSKIIHLEAGLRSFDNSMIEERNRRLVDRISDYYFSPTQLSKYFLENEGYDPKNIFVTGNLIVDACLTYLPIALRRRNNYEKPFLLLTVHRQENVDKQQALEKLVKIFSNLNLNGDRILFPIHPRTRKNLIEFNYKLPPHIETVDPLGYLDFLAALYNCDLVLTDSGGVQEEAITLGKPCITLRRNTERWETLSLGANVLHPLDSELDLSSVIDEMKSNSLRIKSIKNPYGEKGVTKRTVEIIKHLINNHH